MTSLQDASRDDAPQTSRAGEDWKTFGLVGLTLLVTQAAYYLTAAALPLYLHDLGAAESHIGFEVGVANICGLAANFLIGPALDRYGAVRFLWLGGVLYLVSSTGMLLLPGEVPITVFRALQGVGGAAILPASFTLGSRLVPDRQATALGLMGAVNNLSLAIGPPLGLALYMQGGARGLLVPSIGAAVLGLAFAALVPALPRTPGVARGFAYNPSWTRPLVANGLGAMYFGGIIAYLPLVLQRVHGPNAGIFFTADALGVLILRIPTGVLVDRYGTMPAEVLGVLLTLPGIAVLALHPSIGVLVLSGAFTGIGAGLLITGVMADLSLLSTESNRGTAMALGGGTFSGAFFVGSAVSGLLIGRGGFNAVLLFGFVSCAAALPFVIRRPGQVTAA